MGRPAHEPVGLLLARTARAASRAFDQVLTEAGGSRPAWLILLDLKRQRWDTQAQLARSVGVTGPTLTHHLDAMEERGWVTRRRAPDNRRVHMVELTREGEQMFEQLRTAAASYDARLRSGLTAGELTLLRDLLARLQRNVGGDDLPAS